MLRLLRSSAVVTGIHIFMLSGVMADSGVWDSETSNSQCMKQLHELGAVIQGTQEWKNFNIAKDVTVSPLRPDQLTVSEQAGLTLESGGFRENEKQTGKSAAELTLRQWSEGLKVERTSFKIIRIDLLDNSKARTRVLAGVYGRDEQGLNGERHGTWLVDWDLSGTTPMITQWKGLEYHASYSKSLFRDETGRMFAKAPDAWRQLRISAPDWLNQMGNEVANTQNFYQGVSVADINGDGLEDVFICQGDGMVNRMLVQLPSGEVKDVTKASGLDLLDRTRAAVFGDLDNDGDADLVLATKRAILIYKNDGTGVFVRELVLMDYFPSLFSLSLADYNQDGRLDLYACHYYKNEYTARFATRPAPNLFHDATNGGENKLFRNVSASGELAFEDVTARVGLDQDNHYFSLACSWHDYDNDGDLDLYVANDFGKNQFFRNDGGTFVNIINEVHLQDQNFSMNAVWGDWNRDGKSDLYVSNMFSSAGMRITNQDEFQRGKNESETKTAQHLSRGNSLFTQQKNAVFKEDSSQQNVWLGRWAWAAAFADVDHNGWQDLMVTNGYLSGKKKDDL